tara:strand:+ start:82 stop:573 length:492 start_codon:yes stop_codon:yes gene_type:complete
MRKLFCFIGKPGCGKTTLLTHLGVSSFDVLKYIKRYLNEKGSLIKEEYALLAYKEMFSELEIIRADVVYLELGTNYSEFVIENIKKLNFSTTIILCLLDDETCLKRCSMREQKIGTEQLLRRMQRPFPNEHLRFIAETNISHYQIDMSKDVQKNANFIAEFLK